MALWRKQTWIIKALAKCALVFGYWLQKFEEPPPFRFGEFAVTEFVSSLGIFVGSTLLHFLCFLALICYSGAFEFCFWF
jgi:hypothetical protein